MSGHFLRLIATRIAFTEPQAYSFTRLLSEISLQYCFVVNYMNHTLPKFNFCLSHVLPDPYRGRSGL